MKKSVGYVLAFVIVFVFVLFSVNSQEDMERVDNSAFKHPQRVSASFRHDEHNENAGIEDCSECHHLYEDGKKIEGESSEDQYCWDCHGLKASGSRPALMKAFHINCKGCHLEQKQGPVTCGECHKK
jgi:hypothetical protein